MKNIIPENIYQEVTSCQNFYSLMYPDYVKFMPIEKQIVGIKTSFIRWNPNKTLFYYIWGWPGPDANMYDSENYGKNWAFTKEELIEYWNKKDKMDKDIENQKMKES